MSRNKFAASWGAFGKNVNWNWSWINEEKKFVIFGASTVHEAGDVQRILSKDWERSHKGRKHSGYSQALRHLARVTDDGFTLFTFRQKESDPDPETGNVRMITFEQQLEERSLRIDERNWYAVPANDFEPIHRNGDEVKVHREGTKILVSMWRAERNPEARQACLDHHGYKCKICEFDFEANYGCLGKGFIHVHHLNPLAKSDGERSVDPKEDLIPVCPNCHAMIHKGGATRTIEEIKLYRDKSKKA